MIKEEFKKGLSEAEGLAILKTMLEKDERTEDRSGRTRLVTLAEEIKQSNPKDENREVFEWVINRSAVLLPKLSISGVTNLHFLLKSSKINPGTYAPEYRSVFMRNKSWRLDPGKTRQRAEVFRLLSESGENFNQGELKGEIQIKEKFPWLWIDVATRFYWEGVLQEVSSRLEKEGDGATEELLQRIPLWCRLRGDRLIDDIKNSWVPSPFLNDRAKERIAKSLQARGFSLNTRGRKHA